jgi:hypothetical protein
MISFSLGWQGRLRKVTAIKSKNKSKSREKKEVDQQQGLAIIGSIIIILMALGGLGLVFNVFL